MTTPTTVTLVDFLLARIAEDESAARAAASGGRWTFADSRDVGAWTLYDETWRIADLVTYPRADQDYRERFPASRNRPPYYVDADANGTHIARWDPARVLADCEAKRRIVQEVAFMKLDPLTMGWVLQQLAVPFADHEDYDPAWMPFT